MEITSRQNALIKDIIKLKQKKHRDREGLYFFEGVKLFEEAVEWNLPIKMVFLTDSGRARFNEAFLKALETADVKLYTVTEPVMAAMSEQKMPEGVLCVAQKPSKWTDKTEMSKIFDEIHKKSEQKTLTCVILEDVQDPGNVGTIIRTADAAGFDLVLCSEKTADIYSGKVLRAAMGSVFHLPVIQTDHLKEVVIELKKKGLFLMGSSLKGCIKMPDGLGEQSSAGLILGNESKGMSEDLALLCDVLYKIPMYGHAESLNVSVASGILMYDLARELKKTD